MTPDERIERLFYDAFISGWQAGKGPGAASPSQQEKDAMLFFLQRLWAEKRQHWLDEVTGALLDAARNSIDEGPT